MKQVQQKYSVIDEESVKVLIKAFKESFTGIDKSAKTVKLLDILRKHYHLNLNDRTLRKYVGYIRENNLLDPGYILSNVRCGYWLSLDESEQDDYLMQEMTRMSHQFANVAPLHKKLRYNNPKSKTEQIPLFQT